MSFKPRLAALLPWAGFTGLAGLILGPLLAPGYILTLDMVWTPQIPFRPEITNLYPFHLLLYGLGLIVPSMLVQKAVLVLILVLAGVGAYRLVLGRLGTAPAWLAGLVYVLNPFVYTRLMAGQYLVLAGYALLPWFVRSLWRLIDKPDGYRAGVVAAWSVAIGLVSIHALGVIGLVTVIMLLARCRDRRQQLGRVSAWLAGVAGVWLVANAFWLVPARGLGRQVASFGWDQFKAYATTGGSVGVPLNALTLQGFWGDPLGRYVLPSATGALFWVACVLVVSMVLLGAWRSVQRSDWNGWALGLAGLIAWVLAMGIAWAPGAGLTHWLVQHLPFYQGYREPQKWLMLLALAYAYLAAAGLSWLQEYTRGWVRESVLVGGLLLPLAWAPMLLWGTAGQLRSVDYPASWYQLQERLARSHAAGRILILPWHQYVALDFAGRTVANPASAFWGARAVVSQDPELLGVRVTAGRSVDDVVGRVLAASYYSHEAGAQLAAANIRQVVLLKQADWRQYSWLAAQSDLKLEAETSGWQLYNVEVTP